MAERVSFPTVLHAQLVLGAPYSGKTQKLLTEIEGLLRGGIDASEIRVFCATPDAAQSLATRLRAQTPHPGAQEVEITTPRAFFLELLGTQEARTVTGRKARLLLPFEYDFFLEDLKTSGVRPRRLREILKFFYKGLSELADEDEGWLITNEERGLFGLVRSCLGFTGALLEPELANLAVKYLRSGGQAGQSARRSYVFVDDFHLLSRASQVASCLLAKEGLYLSSDQDVAIEVYESYPYPDGADEFAQANPQAVFTRLATSYSCYPAARASRALRWENGTEIGEAELPESEGTTFLQCIEGETPHDEMAGVAEAVGRALEDGLSAEDITVAAPHPAWMWALAQQLEARGICAEVLLTVRFLKGDIRDNGKSLNARFLTILNLIADPTDAVAWRCWCGFGDYLVNSNGMRSLRNLGQAQGKTLELVLETSDLAPGASDGLDAIAGVRRIMKARDEAHALIARLSGLGGQALLEAIARELIGPDAQVPGELETLVAGGADEAGDNSAASMVRRLRARVEFPVYHRKDAVKVVAYQNMVGVNPRYLILAGFMNGFFPKRDYFEGTVLTVEQRERRYAKDLARIASVVAKASDTLAVSYCEKLDLEDAERLKLVVSRVLFENGRRVAKTEPSIFLEFMCVEGLLE
ncbi:MAG: hypothetical protein LBC23_04300 [Coriobacteriales bacterium]|jgi:hypothetical protein|nr:hypothetical protein [Coriobacteriales bacterium]